jgi:hypothetical protein
VPAVARPFDTRAIARGFKQPDQAHDLTRLAEPLLAMVAVNLEVLN